MLPTHQRVREGVFFEMSMGSISPGPWMHIILYYIILYYYILFSFILFYLFFQSHVTLLIFVQTSTKHRLHINGTPPPPPPPTPPTPKQQQPRLQYPTTRFDTTKKEVWEIGKWWQKNGA